MVDRKTRTTDPAPDSAVIDAAAEFLNQPLERHGSEGNLQSDLEALLRKIGVVTLESHYSTADGEADIYLPNRRTFLELKAYPGAVEPNKPQHGRASESPLTQLDRYVIGEINRELGRIPFDDGEYDRHNWMGIVTDGRNWHLYEYPHKYQSMGRSVGSARHFMNEAQPLAAFLCSLLSERQFGREWIPSDPGVLFTELNSDLISLYQQLPAKAKETTRTKMELWLDMMRTSGMVPKDDEGKERLFVTHSFLIAVVRFVSHSLPSSPQSDWESVLQEGFTAWVLEFERGRKWAEKLYHLVSVYDWRRREEDVLRSLYQHIVSAHDRKIFGEFYTPDWLAAMMVEEVLDDEWLEHAINAAVAAIRSNSAMQGIGVLDPTCGSGTFLIHAAHRLLCAEPMRNFTPVEKADIVTRLINGMDIHPVAVELARVNLERILPAPPSMGHQAFQIHLGDSLQTDSSGQQSLFGHTSDLMRVMTPKGRELLIPVNFVKGNRFANDMRQLVNAAKQKHELPEYLTTSMTEDEIGQMKKCHSTLMDIIAEEGNSVWTWYTINIAAPYLLAMRKVNRIVANPPWVKLADIQIAGRKSLMEQYGRSLGVFVGGVQAPHNDIASYFILAARRLYMANPETDPASWLVKKSAISSGQWGLFREKHKNTLRQSVDLEQLQPFGGGDATRSCLLMEHCSFKRYDSSGVPRLEARLNTKKKGSRPKPTESSESARRKFEFAEAPDPLPTESSAYLADGRIKQGATLVPHVLAILNEVEGPDHDNLMKVTTQRSVKNPWKKVSPQTGNIPSHWVRPVLTSSQMMVYIPGLRTMQGIVPADEQGKLLEVPETICPFWSELDEIYESHSGIGEGTPKTLLKQFDFQSKLSTQLNIDETMFPWMVLYPSSGDIMRAARVRTKSGVADSTLFWLPVHNLTRAHT